MIADEDVVNHFPENSQLGIIHLVRKQNFPKN